MMNLKTPAVLLSALLLAGGALSAQEERELKDSDLKKLAKPYGQWVEAKVNRDSEGALVAREELEKQMVSVQKKVKKKPLLSLVADWEAVLDTGRTYAKKGYKTGKVEENGRFFSRVPKKHKAGKESWPLLILLSDKSPASAIEALPAEFLDTAVVVAPDMSGLDEASSLSEEGRIRILGSIGQISIMHRLDRNRFWLLGEGDFASAAARCAALWPHIFSAVAVVGGDKSGAGLAAPNLALTNLGEQGDSAAACSWLAEQAPRMAYPTEFEVTFTEPWAGRYYWVQARTFESVEGGSAEDKDLASLKVSVDKSSNTITLEGKLVYQVDLYLNDRIVNLDEPIKIKRNGVDYEYRATRSVGTLLDNFASNLDAGAVFPVIVRRIDLPQEDKES